MGVCIDIVGQKFGKLLVLKRVENAFNRKARFLCKCDCGNEKAVRSEDLRSGNTKSCGCLGGVFNDLTGQRFGRLFVLRRVGNDRKGNAQFLCECGCGNTVVILGWCLSTKHTKSCGCLRKDVMKELMTTHGEGCGEQLTIEYSKWQGMKNRCFSPSYAYYKHYGGRGITVCDRWLHSYPNFLADIGRCPEGLTLDRIDNDGDYTPENCRWATAMEQAGNKSNNRWLTFRGRTQILMDWVREWGISHSTLKYRLKKGHSMEEIFNYHNSKKEVNNYVWI